VPRNDRESQTLPQPPNEEKRVDSSLRENPWKKKLIILHEVQRGFRGNLLKRTDEIASCLPMTAKAKHYHSHRVKKRELIRHCEKSPEEEAYYFTRSSKGFSWQSSKAY